MNVKRFVYMFCLFLLTVYQVGFLLYKYIANEDTSTVHLQTFRKSRNKHFPAITLCFYSNTADGEESGDGDGLYNDLTILKSIGINGSVYRDIILGKIRDSFWLERSLTNITFETATIKLQTYLKKFRVQDNNHKQIIKWKQKKKSPKHGIPSSLFLSYQDPIFICYTHYANHDDDLTVNSIDFYFYLSKLQNITKGQLYIYVHYKNQLIRHLRYLHKIRDFHGLTQEQSNNMVTIDLSYLSVMKRREDANDPCDINLQNDDDKWLQYAIDLNGCIPPYWKTFMNNSKTNDCKTAQQLMSASNLLALDNENLVSSIFESYIAPCFQMRIMANTNNDYYKKAGIFKLKFRLR